MLTRRSALAGILSLLYLVPALLLFVLLMICFTGRAVCPAGIYALPLSPILASLEWPWEKIATVGMFSGPIWGKVFVLSSILINAVVIFALGKGVEWLTSGRFERPRAHARRALMWLCAKSRRFLSRLRQPASGAAAIYLVAALLLWIEWQFCSGWTWLCSAPRLESLAGPWARWMGWTLAGSSASAEAMFGPLGVRLFVLVAVGLNAALIFLAVRGYERIYRTFRHDPPGLAGISMAMVYAIAALFFYIDALLCQGMLCDLGLMLAALPWSLNEMARSREDGRLVVLGFLGLNTVLVYGVSIAVGRLARALLTRSHAN